MVLPSSTLHFKAARQSPRLGIYRVLRTQLRSQFCKTKFIFSKGGPASLLFANRESFPHYRSHRCVNLFTSSGRTNLA